MTSSDADGGENDECQVFQVHSNRGKRGSIPKRVYVGNLPDIPDLRKKLQSLLLETVQVGVSIQAITVHGFGESDNSKRKKSRHALIECPQGTTEKVISRLHKTSFEGRSIVVQRERRSGKGKQPQKLRDGTTKFGSWSRPSGGEPSGQDFAATVLQPMAVNSSPQLEATTGITSPIHFDEAAERVSDVVTKEFQEAERAGEDLVNLGIASTAAMSFLASMATFGSMPSPIGQKKEKIIGIDEDVARAKGEKFQSYCAAQSLSDLLEEFGEADPNWMNQQPSNISDSKAKTIVAHTDNPSATATQRRSQQQESRLGQHGRAPIHVEYSSFGYFFGAPTEIKNGLSHAQPLPPIDCCNFPAVPSYLEWQDGLSGAVKRVLLQSSKQEIRACANELAGEVVQALEDAVASGYGYAQPLTMVIFVGSHSGRHRSVLFSELAATALRTRLRNNYGNRISLPVSVGTHHRHLEGRGGKGQYPTPRGQNKNKYGLEGDW